MTKTSIEWTDRNWNPVRAYVTAPDGTRVKWGYHCEHVHHGCDNCYAEAMNRRNLPSWGTGLPFKPSYLKQIPNADCDRLKYPRGSRLVIDIDEKALTEPLRIKRPQKWFLSSMTDVFGLFVTDALLDRIFAVMALAVEHTFQVLTKRPDRAVDYLRKDETPFQIRNECLRINSEQWDRQRGIWPLPNVWLGTSISTQADADAMIPHLLAAPAAVRFVSAEPLLGPLNFLVTDMRGHDISSLRGIACDPSDPYGPDKYYRTARIDWIIVGGESGQGARPMHSDWVRSIRDQALVAGTAFFFKQWGEWAPVTIDEGMDGNLTPAYADDGCSNPAHHHNGQPCLFWQEESLVQWPHLKALPATGARRIGKNLAGRTLDGRECGEFPGVARNETT